MSQSRSDSVDGSVETNKNTTTYAYDAYRRLTNTLYADGGVVSMGYDTNGNVAWQTDQRGYTTTFTNDVMGRTTRVDNPDGSYGTFTYDATGLNTGSRDRGGVLSATTLNSRGQVASTAQGVGTGLYRSNLSQFDSLGRPSGSRDAMGYWTHASYNVVSQQTGSTDALGNTTGNVYDLAGQLIQYRNELGQVTRQVHDPRGRVIETINSLNQRTTSTFDEAGNRTVFWDALGHRVTSTFDALNRAYQVQTSATQFNTTTFDAVGNVWTTTDAANKTTTFTYDAMNRQKTVTNAANETTTFQYDLAGNTTAVTNARNQTTTSVYDSMNRVVETINPDNQRATIVYAVSGVVEKTINALNQTATMLYDALNQGIGSINALGQTSSSILDALGRAVGSIDASGKVYTNWFDQVGRGIGGVDGLGNATRTFHDATGNVVRSVDANGNATEYRYDSLNRRTVTIDPNGGRVTQTFDANGNLTTYTDPLGNTTTFVYDTLNREIERIDALGNSLTYAYDARNLMNSQTDRLGRRKDWTYDDLGRVLTETWVTGGSTVNVLVYDYDANGNMTLAQDDDGTYTLTYDNQDRVETIDGLFGVSLTFQYDALSRRTWVEDSFGGVMSSTYDAAGRLEKRQFGGSGMATLTYERDHADNGEMLAARRYSDLSSTNLIGSTTYGYDAGYRLTNIQHKDGTGTNIAAYTMTFDAGGRITEENRNGTSVTYAYDTRSQLTQAGADGYSYDDNGNRTMAGYSTGGMNQLLNDGTFTYTYDLEGNVSTKSKGSGLETWYYAYDHNNRLTSVRKTSDGTTNTLTVTYSYDVFGNRVKEDKWSSGPGLVTTKFVHLGQEVYFDLDNSNAVLMRYIQGDTADEMIVRIDGGNVVDWFLADRLGSIRDIVDGSGTVIDSITYDAYGKLTAETNSANRGRYAWVGMEFDGDAVLYGTKYRPTYDPTIGRPYNSDPIWFRAGDSNLYRWVGNNPTNLTDPSGLQGTPAAPQVYDTHLPAANRGTWIDGWRGNGVFEYSDTPHNQARELVGIQVRFSNGYIGLGAFPADWYYGGSSASATVIIPKANPTDKADFDAADDAMRKTLKDPNWKRPVGYTWNHAGGPGSTTLELVDKEKHGRVAHEAWAGPQRAARAQQIAANKAAIGKIAAKAGVFLQLRDAIMAARDGGEFTEVNAPAYFSTANGSVFVVRIPELSLFYSPYREYVAGPRRGEKEYITDAVVQAHEKDFHDTWGKYIPGGLFSTQKFIPGTLRKTLPVRDTWSGEIVGYVDETGFHRKTLLFPGGL